MHQALNVQSNVNFCDVVVQCSFLMWSMLQGRALFCSSRRQEIYKSSTYMVKKECVLRVQVWQVLWTRRTVRYVAAQYVAARGVACGDRDRSRIPLACHHSCGTGC